MEKIIHPGFVVPVGLVRIILAAADEMHPVRIVVQFDGGFLCGLKRHLRESPDHKPGVDIILRDFPKRHGRLVMNSYKLQPVAFADEGSVVMAVVVVIDVAIVYIVGLQQYKVVVGVLAAASGEDIRERDAGDGAVGLRGGKVPDILEAAIDCLALGQVSAATLYVLRGIYIVGGITDQRVIQRSINQSRVFLDFVLVEQDAACEP